MKKKVKVYFLVSIMLTVFNLNAQEYNPAELKRDWEKYIKKKDLIEYLEKATLISESNTKELPFKNLKYNKVLAYDYEGSEQGLASITDDSGEFIPVVTKQISLNKKQVDQLIKILTDKKSYGEATAACFNPHMAIVFFDDKNVVFKVDICLDCNYLISSETILAMNHKKHVFEDGNFNYYNGFTKSGKNKIKNLARELDFFYGN